MDNDALMEIVRKIPKLKYLYLGSFPADHIPPLTEDSFAIVNTEPLGRIGQHWIMVARKDENHFYADSLGLALNHYKNIRVPGDRFSRLVFKQLQEEAICGLYCIYFAWLLFNEHKLLNSMTDLDVFRFIYKFL